MPDPPIEMRMQAMVIKSLRGITLAVGAVSLAALAACASQLEPAATARPSATAMSEATRLGSPIAKQRLVLRNAAVVSWNDDGSPATARGQSVIVERGLIIDVKESQASDLRPGDVLVDAEGRWVVSGMVRVVGDAPDRYGSMTHDLLCGVTTIAAPFGLRRIEWLRRIAATAAIPIPALADLPPDVETPPREPSRAPAEKQGDSAAAELRARTVGAARALGLVDRGEVKVGQRADLLIVDRDPLVDPTSVEVPIEVILGGEPIRSIAVITHRAMIADANRAMAAHPPAANDHDRYETESSGLRVGFLEVKRDGLSGSDWWGPPVEQTTTWSRTPMAGGEGWSLDLVEDLVHGFRVSMHLTCGAKSIAARAQVLRPEELPPAEMSLDASAEAPLLDPVSLVRQAWPKVAALPPSSSHELDVVEPIPMLGKVKVGIRRMRLTHLAANAAPLPVREDERFILIEAMPVDASERGPSEFGWVITDRSGLARRASLIAPEGITEYFLSLPQPAVQSEPQQRRH